LYVDASIRKQTKHNFEVKHHLQIYLLRNSPPFYFNDLRGVRRPPNPQLPCPTHSALLLVFPKTGGNINAAIADSYTELQGQLQYSYGVAVKFVVRVNDL